MRTKEGKSATRKKKRRTRIEEENEPLSQVPFPSTVPPALIQEDEQGTRELAGRGKNKGRRAMRREKGRRREKSSSPKAIRDNIHRSSCVGIESIFATPGS